MAKNIDVQAHVNRYLETEPADIKALITGLTDLLETQKERKKAQLKAQLEALESGEIPEVIKPAPRPTRKKVTKDVAQEESN